MTEVDNKTKIEIIKKWLGTGSINIFGLPFSGKDTHSHILADVLGGEVVGGGDILRGKHVSQHVKNHVAAGELTPTEEYLDIVLPYFSRKEFINKPLILSSVGRWHGEEASVIQAAKNSGHPIKVVIFLSIGREEVIKRHGLSVNLDDRGQRHDDAELALDKRFQEFKQKTLPVIDYYRQIGLLIEVDGSPPISSVNDKILEKLAAKANLSD